MPFQIVHNSFNDSPDGTALVLFYNKCNLHCDYCYNHNLFTIEPKKLSSFEEAVDEIKRQLIVKDNRKPFLKNEWLILSGGEPLLLSYDAFYMLSQIAHEINMKVGIWTNLLYKHPSTNEKENMDYLEIIHPEHKCIDWMNIDYKGTEEVYLSYGATEKDYKRFKSRIGFLLTQKQIPIQLSTVVYKKIHTQSMLKNMVDFINTQMWNTNNLPKITWRFVQLQFPHNEPLYNNELDMNNIIKKDKIKNMLEKTGIYDIPFLNVKIE
jgi:pyruvate-formate lyase-activating enzyme